MAHTSQTHDDYQIGVICALAIEKAAVVAMLDEMHPKLKKEKSDENEYILGRIGVHNVVIACLPAGLIGNGPAATVAKDMLRSFPINFGFMVGVGGGVWSKKNDIRLGDIVVSQPTSTHGGVVQWDFGKTGEDGKFRRAGSLDKPPPILLHALGALQTVEETDGVDLEEHLSKMIRDKPWMAEKYEHQGMDNDMLFEASYQHEDDETCNGCDAKFIIQRPARNDATPRIHYGNIASGNEVMKHGATRDRIAKEEGVICFEMEAAGLMNNFRCLVIRGICDYADSHKNKLWLPYAAATAAAFAKVLLGFIDEQEVAQMCSPPRPRRVLVLPFGRNKDFVGRQSHLNRLITILHTHNDRKDCPRAALVGLGGAGKTQIALECVFQLQKFLPVLSVFWVRASDAASFDSAYRDIGRQLKIPGLEDDKADVRRLVKTRLSQEGTGSWLMIIDNADDFELFYNDTDIKETGSLSEYLPFSMLGAILFTTRDRAAATKYAGSNMINVEEMDDTESKELLQRSLQNKRLVDDKDSTTTLLKLLVNLPLAIMQAAAYLNAKTCTIAEYLRVYQESSDNTIKLLSKDFEDRRRYPDMKNPVATTWLISFEQIQVRDPLAADYMAFIACIKEQDIPRDLLPPASEFDRMEALGTLKAFGFIRERLSGVSYDMHRLVHVAMQNWLKHKDEWGHWNEKTLKCIAGNFPWPEHENRALWMMYLPHAKYALKCSFGETRNPPWNLLHNLGGSFRMICKFADAEAMDRQALHLNETALGKEHPDTLRSTNNLALSLRLQGKYAEAKAMHQQTLRRRERVLGKHHPETLQSMNDLALCIHLQGEHIVAEEMHQKTLDLRKIMLGKEHPSTLQSMMSLAASLLRQGKYAAAEVIHQQTLQLKERVLGKEHPDTLGSMNDLAECLRGQGKNSEAQSMHQKTLRLREKVLGKDHLYTLESMNNLALSLRGQDKNSEAEAIHRQTLQLGATVLGSNHPSTLTSMNNLALSLHQQGKYSEAEAIYRQTLQLREKVLGKEHPDTLKSMYNLVSLLCYQGKDAEAEAMGGNVLHVLPTSNPENDESAIGY